MTPQIGDEVIVRWQGRKPSTDGFVIQGQTDPVHTAVGTLGVEMSGDEMVGLVIEETDGGATYVPRHAVLTMEVL